MKINKTLLALLMAKNSFGMPTRQKQAHNGNSDSRSTLQIDVATTPLPLVNNYTLESTGSARASEESDSEVVATAKRNYNESNGMSDKLISLREKIKETEQSPEEKTFIAMMQYVKEEGFLRKYVQNFSIPATIGLTFFGALKIVLERSMGYTLSGDVNAGLFFISGLVALGIFHLIKKCYIITTQDSDIKLIEKNLEIFKSEEFKIKEFKDSPNEKAIKKELDKLKSVKKGLNTENIESIMLEIFKIAYKITSETEQANQPGIP